MEIDSKKINVFVAYSREDEAIRNKLDAHLYSLIRQNKIIIWFDGLIQPGEPWLKEIDKNLANADIILLLVSANFISSDFCYGYEMETALNNHKEGKSTVIPIIVSHCSWENMPFSHLQVLPEKGTPIMSREWADINEACFQVVKSLEGKIRTIQQSQHAKLESFWNEKNSLESEIKDLKMQKLYLISELQKYKIDIAKQKINEDIADLLFLIYNDTFITLHLWANKFEASRTTKDDSILGFKPNSSIRNEGAVELLLRIINEEGAKAWLGNNKHYNSDLNYKKDYLLKDNLPYIETIKAKISQLEKIAINEKNEKIIWRATLYKLKLWVTLLEGRNFFLEDK